MQLVESRPTQADLKYNAKPDSHMWKEANVFSARFCTRINDIEADMISSMLQNKFLKQELLLLFVTANIPSANIQKDLNRWFPNVPVVNIPVMCYPPASESSRKV